MHPIEKIINFLKNLNNINKIIISIILIVFSILAYLSIPALYKYDSLQKQLSEKILKDFNIYASLSNEINYNVFPQPNFTIKDNLINFNKNNEFGEAKKIKVFISLKNLFSQKKIIIKKLKIYDSNFIINIKNYEEFKKYLKTKNKKKITIINSKIFFKDSANDETLSIATIKNASIIFDEKKKFKKFNSKGLIFNTKYNLNFNQDLENFNIQNTKINFKDLKFKIENMLSEKFNDENFSGQSEISIFRQKIRLKYEQNKDDFIFKTEKNNNLKLSGTITKSPFYFDIQIFLNNSNIKNIQILLSKLGNYLNNNYLLNKNFNGKLLLNIKDIHGSKYFNSTKILISFSNGKISLDESKIYIKKIGYLELKNFIITKKKNTKVYIESKNLFKINNLKEFNRAIQLPKNKKINIESIYFELNKNLEDESFLLKKIIFNNIHNKSELNKLDLTKNLYNENINNIKNWFQLRSFLRELFVNIK